MFRPQAVRFASAFMLATFLVVGHAAANYPERIPNGYVNSCVTCHLNSGGGGGCGTPPCLNAFGNQFNANGRVWNSTLANQNADGDAFTNGRELLDPLGQWDQGDPAPGNSAYVTLPAQSQTTMSECSIVSVTVDGFFFSYASWSANGSCTETAGVPGYTTACNAGYMGNGVTCSDVNECTMPVGRCGQGSCVNSPGTFTCNCNNGYYFNGNTCSQDACVRNVDDCNSANATCTPSVSDPLNAWTCGCAPGYTGYYATQICTLSWMGFCLAWAYSNWTCANIDECTTGSAGCPATSACVDTLGSFTCAACGANAHVVGAVNAESCVCDAHYSGNPYSGCVDDDECFTNVDDCGVNAVCTNTPGSFTCACATGYTGDGHTCADYDECVSTKLNDCSENAKCENTAGAYTCTCNAHFTGNGRVCADVNECTEGTAACGQNEVCQNLYGERNTCACRPGFARVTEGGACVSSCGNGLRALQEHCDDGNTTSGDGCSATCRVEQGFACYEPAGTRSRCARTCGDELIDPPAETCDDGAENSDTEADACRTNCALARCGDGVLDTGETCDTGDDVSDSLVDACRSTCVPAFCGDGVVDTGERCDPGGGEALEVRVCQRKHCASGGADGGVGGGESHEGGCAVRADGRASDAWLFGLGVVAFLITRRRVSR